MGRGTALKLKFYNLGSNNHCFVCDDEDSEDYSSDENEEEEVVIVPIETTDNRIMELPIKAGFVKCKACQRIIRFRKLEKCTFTYVPS